MGGVFSLVLASLFWGGVLLIGSVEAQGAWVAGLWGWVVVGFLFWFRAGFRFLKLSVIWMVWGLEVVLFGVGFGARFWGSALLALRRFGAEWWATYGYGELGVGVSWAVLELRVLSALEG